MDLILEEHGNRLLTHQRSIKYDIIVIKLDIIVHLHDQRLHVCVEVLFQDVKINITTHF